MFPCHAKEAQMLKEIQVIVLEWDRAVGLPVLDPIMWYQ